MNESESKSTADEEMYVVKRDGSSEIISFDKILKRVKNLGHEFNLSIQYTQLVMKVIDQLYNNIKTSEIDELTAQQCASMASLNPDYNRLAGAIAISNLQKNTNPSFYETMKRLSDFRDVNGKHHKLVSDDFIRVVETNREAIDQMIVPTRDFLFDYFGFKTLERAYLTRCDKVIVERPQHMWMRVAVCIHMDNLDAVRETYDLMSEKCFTHATPTLFNAGTPRPQLSSCFLLAMESDSIDGIFNTLKECAQISKWSGGIGLHAHNIRSTGSHIRGTNGVSNGLIPMLGVFNKTARYVDQGGKRNGSFAIYLEPHHPDIEDFLDLKKNHGEEENRARDLFYAMWISDLFMKRVKANAKWSLFCPDQCPDLCQIYGDEYEQRYEEYERAGVWTRQINARDLWIKILDSQMETGTPYILYKDACNRKSNQKNLGTIQSSNLCVAPETLILTSKGQYKIEDLRDQEVEVWNGESFSTTHIRQTSESSELIEVHTSDNSVLTCTKYHKFYIQNGYQKNPSANKNIDIINTNIVEIVEAQNLQPDMKIIKTKFPVIDNKNMILENAYTNGFFSGDGTYNNPNQVESPCCFKCFEGEQFCRRHNNNKKIDSEKLRENNMCNALSYSKKPLVTLYCEKIKLLEKLAYISTGKLNNNKLNVTLVPTLEEKYFVPMNYSLKSKLDWFAGYCDADGCISRNGTNQSLQISSIHKEFLVNIKLMLQTCGINSIVSLNMNTRKVMLPKNDNTGDYAEYECKTLWRLLIASTQLQKILELGFNPKRLNIEKNIYQRSANKFITIRQVVDNGRCDKTYCFNETERHAGIFNGIITSQCSEIIEYSDDNETAVCNLASISLPSFVKEDKSFDYDRLVYVTGVIVNNLNNIIDINFYPNQKTRRSNFKHRPIGIGVQGLADAFLLMDLPFISDEAKRVNRNIFETIYYGAVKRSMELSRDRRDAMNFLRENYLLDNWRFRDPEDDMSREYTVFNTSDASSSSILESDNTLDTLLKRHRPILGEILGLDEESSGAYSTFIGSPMSEGILQFDMWNVKPDREQLGYDWTSLRAQVVKHGIRNSLLVAPMPTASTAQILGNNECFEPLTSNIYSRRTLAGEFVIVNKNLVKDLQEINMWNEAIKNNIIANRGSVQYLEGLSEHLRDKYKIVWEMPMRDIIDMARDRGAFICQSQSLNLWVEDPDPKILTNIHFYSWQSGLKTGMYYLRRKPKHQPQQFTIEPDKKEVNQDKDDQDKQDQDKNDENDCLMCSG